MAITKIHVIGGSGCGKSTLARTLAARMGVEAVDLDEIFWDSANGYGKKREPEERHKRLAAVLEKGRWVIEGVYDKWVGESFARADCVIVMDVPLWRRQWRILRRSWRRWRGVEKGKKETMISVVKLLEWNARYDKECRTRFMATLQEMGAKVKVVRNKKEVEAVVAEVGR